MAQGSEYADNRARATAFLQKVGRRYPEISSKLNLSTFEDNTNRPSQPPPPPPPPPTFSSHQHASRSTLRNGNSRRSRKFGSDRQKRTPKQTLDEKAHTPTSDRERHLLSQVHTLERIREESQRNFHEELEMAERAISEMDQGMSEQNEKIERLSGLLEQQKEINRQSNTQERTMKSDNNALRATVKELHDSIQRITLGSKDALEAATNQNNALAEEIRVLKQHFMMAKQYKLHTALERLSQDSRKEKQRFQRMIAHMQAEKNALYELLNRAEQDRDHAIFRVQELLNTNKILAEEISGSNRGQKQILHETKSSAEAFTGSLSNIISTVGEGLNANTQNIMAAEQGQGGGGYSGPAYLTHPPVKHSPATSLAHKVLEREEDQMLQSLIDGPILTVPIPQSQEKAAPLVMKETNTTPSAVLQSVLSSMKTDAAPEITVNAEKKKPALPIAPEKDVVSNLLSPDGAKTAASQKKMGGLFSKKGGAWKKLRTSVQIGGLLRPKRAPPSAPK